MPKKLFAHGSQEILVVLGAFHLAEQKLHAVNGVHGRKHLAQNPDPVQGLGSEQQLFLAGAGTVYVNGREDPLFSQMAVQVDFLVARTLELFKNDFVHAGAGINERRGNDGQAAAFFNVSGGAKEAFGPLQGVGVQAA